MFLVIAAYLGGVLTILSPCMALLHGSMGGSRNPQPRLGSSDADGVRASQLQHPVQDMNGDADLGRPTLILARAQSVTDDLLVAPDGGLNAAPFVVAGHLLPPDPAFLGNALKMAVALGWLTRRRVPPSHAAAR
jgi:hypothetical protein